MFPVAWATFIWNNGKMCNSNLKHLKWMEEHIEKFDPPATSDERETLEIEMSKQCQYDKSFILYKLLFPPTVDWVNLPMDQDYVKSHIRKCG